jgi:hypothetical protein
LASAGAITTAISTGVASGSNMARGLRRVSAGRRPVSVARVGLPWRPAESGGQPPPGVRAVQPGDGALVHDGQAVAQSLA